MIKIRSCADKLEGGREIDTVQRTAKLYDDGGHGNDVGLRLLLLATVLMDARVLPPQTSRRRMTKKRGAGRQYSQLSIVYRYGAPWCAFNLLLLNVVFRVQGVGSVLSFSARPDSTMEFRSAPLGSTVASTASMRLHPRPLRACAKPQAGGSLPRRNPLVF